MQGINSPMDTAIILPTPCQLSAGCRTACTVAALSLPAMFLRDTVDPLVQ